MYVRYHPGLLTIKDAEGEGYKKFFSDHIPFLVSIDWHENHGKTIKLISWNVMQDDAFNGVAPLGRSVYGETEEQRMDRHDRIALSIKIMLDQHHPDFVALQEIDAKRDGGSSLFSKIMQQISDDYDYAAIDNEVVDGYGCLTLYEKHKFIPALNTISSARLLKYDEFGGSITTFREIANENGDVIQDGKTIRIISAHAEFCMRPDKYETSINQFLSQENNKFLHETDRYLTKSIIIGDFNCSIAPFHSTLQNIVTNIVPNLFRNNQFQGAHAIDGCFYSSYSILENNILTKQADIISIDPATGDFYSREMLKAFNLGEIQEENQCSEIAIFKIMICADTRYHKKTLPNNENIFTYERKLKKLYNEKMMLVRFARNLNNEEGLGIAITPIMYVLLQSFHYAFPFQLLNHENDYFVFANQEQIPSLIKLFNPTFCLLIQFYEKILLLEKQDDDKKIVCHYKSILPDICHRIMGEDDQDKLTHFIENQIEKINKNFETITPSNVGITTKFASIFRYHKWNEKPQENTTLKLNGPG